MARKARRSPSRRRMRAFFSSETGPIFGCSTNCRWQPRQRNFGVPEALAPLRTTWVARQCGQGGWTRVGDDASCIQAFYSVTRVRPLPYSMQVDMNTFESLSTLIFDIAAMPTEAYRSFCAIHMIFLHFRLGLHASTSNSVELASLSHSRQSPRP